jgi:hypothetical protein
MLAPLFSLVSLIWLVGQLRQAGWSLKRVERRAAYWGLIGIALGLLVTFRSVLPAVALAFGVSGLGAALLYGVVADWQGWWRA